ncbi:unnamed protein product, partial [Hymenolepis diminuta]
MDSTEEFNLISNTILLNPTNELKLSQICNDNKVLIVAFGTGYQLKISAWDYPQRSARTWVCTKGKSQYITSNFESMLSSITHQFMLVIIHRRIGYTLYQHTKEHSTISNFPMAIEILKRRVLIYL